MSSKTCLLYKCYCQKKLFISNGIHENCLSSMVDDSKTETPFNTFMLLIEDYWLIVGDYGFYVTQCHVKYLGFGIDYYSDILVISGRCSLGSSIGGGLFWFYTFYSFSRSPSALKKTVPEVSASGVLCRRISLAIAFTLQLNSNHGGAAHFCKQKFLTGLAGLVYLSPPVHLHDGLICVAFCLLSGLYQKWTGPKIVENNSYLRKYHS